MNHKGYFTETTPDGKVVAEGETHLCVHCGLPFRANPGSGRKRGFCLNCMGPVCGAKECSEICKPWERQMENMERRARLRESVTRNFGV